MLSKKVGLALEHAKKSKKIDTHGEFAMAAGMPLTRLQNMLTGKIKKINNEEAWAIQAAYGIRQMWWTNDKVPMLITKDEKPFEDVLALVAGTTKEVQALGLEEHLTRAANQFLFSLRTGNSQAIKEQLEEIALQKSADYVQVPRHDIRASAGGGSVIHDESIVDHLAFKRDWLTQSMGCAPDQVCVIQVRGDSMTPTINDADLLLLDMRKFSTRTEGVYVIQLQGSLLVKRLRYKVNGAVDVISDNVRYGTETLTKTEASHLAVIGRVVWHGSKF
jgi:phage repressor protein C with HTH and peptisase S24 domain